MAPAPEESAINAAVQDGLQDLEAGRPMELEALVGSVVELGERVGLPMTCTRTVYHCTKLLAQSTAR